MALGFRIYPIQERVSAELIDAFRNIPVANVSDVMSRLAGARLRPMHGKGGMAGPAFTVRTRPGDNLMVHKAIDLAEPGDIIIVDAGGDLTNAIIGELMVAHAVRRRLGGIVINGAVRDFETINGGNFPIFAAGVTHRGPYKDGPGEINVPIAIEGMTIVPGDLVLGDADGIVAVPRNEAEQIHQAAASKHRAEEAQMAAIRDGTDDRSWIDAILTRVGCEVFT